MIEHSISEPSVTESALFVQRPSQSRPPYILPNDPNFTPSINGRNGWRYENFYEISDEVRTQYFQTSLYPNSVQEFSVSLYILIRIGTNNKLE
jgi:hypothetical protein